MPQLSASGSTRNILLLLLIVLAGFTLRVWDINFDQGIGSHPDERSTACFYAASIHWPASWDEFWDPHRSPLNPLWNRTEQHPMNFTYGHFPLYLGVAMGNVLHGLAPVAARVGVPDSAVALMSRADGACDAIAVAGRLLIALLDTLTIVLLFVLGSRIFAPTAGLLAAAFYAFTAQAIQLSHFFAMDPASTTFTMLAVIGAVSMVQQPSWRAALLAGLGAGLAISSKFSALPILMAPVVAALLVIIRQQTARYLTGRGNARMQFNAFLAIPLALATAVVVFAVTSPYAILDWKSFINATLVEQGRMVRGLADFPFTRQYRNTTPYLYFLQQQLAWGIWWPLGAVVALGTIYSLGLMIVSSVRLIYAWIAQRGKVLTNIESANIVLWSWVLPYFGLTGAFLAKFNRYMSPVLPFAMLFGAALIWQLWQGLRLSHPTSDSSHAVDATPTRGGFFFWLGRGLAVVLAVVGLAGGIFWSLAYVNGVYNHEHTWITASRWIYQHVPSGSILLWEVWDDPLPKTVPGEPGMDMNSTGLRNIDWSPYEEDTADKYEIMKAKLREADYVVYSSKRIYGSVAELPERYPMTNRYYQAMWSGELGFELVQEVTSPPRLFGWVFDDRNADESWSLYDHAQVSIFKKVRQLSDADYDALFAGTWEKAIPYYMGEGPAISPWLNALGLGSSPESANRGLINRVIALVTNDTQPEPTVDANRPSLMLDEPLAELPVVDNYRWNRAASTNTTLAIIWWWLVISFLGWVAWPLAFWLFRPLRDRGYFLSRALGWLLAGWLLWWLASWRLAINSVANAWLTVAVLALFGLAAAVAQWSTLRPFLRRQWPMLLIGEVLFAAAYLFFVRLRMGNPDLWQPWFGGEKFMEFAILNGILRSPFFPPVDPHFAGGIINYYYFGIYLVTYLIKLTGIYAEVAFNLAIPTLFALTVLNAFGVAYSAVRTKHPLPVTKGTRSVALAEPRPQPSAPALSTAGQNGEAAVAVLSTPVHTDLAEWETPPLPQPERVTSEAVVDSGEHGQSVVTHRQSAEGTPPVNGQFGAESGHMAATEAAETAAERAPDAAATHPPLAADSSAPNIPKGEAAAAAEDHWRDGLFAALLAPLFVALLSNLESFAQVVRNLAQLSDSAFRSSFPLLETLVHAANGLRHVWLDGATLPAYDFWGPSRVIPATINEFPYWSFLFADLHPHLIGIPFGVLFLGLLLLLFCELIRPAGLTWQRSLVILAVFALMLGTLASVNLWDLPTYFGLGVLAYMVGQYRSRGQINWWLTILVAIVYPVAAYALYYPFLHNYENVGASGVGFVREGDALGQWLLIWGFFGFVLLSWLAYAAGQPLLRTAPHDAGANERWLGAVARHFDRLPRFLYLHGRLVAQPALSYLLTIAMPSLTLVVAVGALLWGRPVLALCLAPLGLLWLLLWRRSTAADPGALFVTLLTITGLAILAGTQVVYLKDFLQGGDWYRMNTLFKFFNQVWVLWGVAAAIALPRLWQGYIAQRHWRAVGVRALWSVSFVILFAASFAYLVWGTPARLDQRFPGWRPPIGTLNGLDFMREGVFYWPDQNNPMALHDDWQAIQWLEDHVRGNVVIVESSLVSYYREAGSRIASMTGLSGLQGMHEGEQRYGDVVGQRSALHDEFWSTPDIGRTQQIMQELQVSLIYVGPLERHQHPEGVQKLEEMAKQGLLDVLYHEGSIVYVVPGRLILTNELGGVYVPKS
ncbi:MAG: DUF2298 domain-containing protein [Caldilineaceae bacterium]